MTPPNSALATRARTGSAGRRGRSHSAGFRRRRRRRRVLASPSLHVPSGDTTTHLCAAAATAGPRRWLAVRGTLARTRRDEGEAGGKKAPRQAAEPRGAWCQRVGWVGPFVYSTPRCCSPGLAAFVSRGSGPSSEGAPLAPPPLPAGGEEEGAEPPLSRATDPAGRDDRQTPRARRSRARARGLERRRRRREREGEERQLKRKRGDARRAHTHAGAFHSLGACRRTRQKNTAVTKRARASARAKERTTAAAAAGAPGKEKRALWLAVVERGGGRGPERTRGALRKNRGSKYLRARRRRRAFGDGQVCALLLSCFLSSFCSSFLAFTRSFGPTLLLPLACCLALSRPFTASFFFFSCRFSFRWKQGSLGPLRKESGEAKGPHGSGSGSFAFLARLAFFFFSFVPFLPHSTVLSALVSHYLARRHFELRYLAPFFPPTSLSFL